MCEQLTYELVDLYLGWSTKFSFREIFISYFARKKILFREISYREIIQNVAKCREIFVTKLNFSKGKIHF
jgi:hypothetical protein